MVPLTNTFDLNLKRNLAYTPLRFCLFFLLEKTIDKCLS